MNLLLKSYIDKPLGASSLLAPGYPPYGIGNGIGGSPQASLAGSLFGSFGARFGDSFIGSIQYSVVGSLGEWLRASLVSRLLVSL